MGIFGERLKSQRGFISATVLFVIFVFIVLGGIAAKATIDYFERDKESRINSDKAQIKSASKTYHLFNDSYPVFEYDLGDQPEISDDYQFFKLMQNALPSLTDEEINGRFKRVNEDLLVNDEYFTKLSSNESFYLDTVTGEILTLKDLEDHKTIGEIQKGIGEGWELGLLGEVKIESGGREMTEIRDSILYREGVLVSGAGTLKLAYITWSGDTINFSYKVTDLTDKVDGSSYEAGELRKISNNRFMVNIFQDGELKFKTIEWSGN